jgi:heat shock protein HslJ
MKVLSPLLAMAIALTACLPRSETPVAPPDAAHSSRNALDWSGDYEGTLPCADCPGIQTRLTLRKDETFELSSLAQQRDKAPRVASGRFTWQASGNAITLDAQGGGQQILIGEGRVALFEPGAVASWAQAQQRVLQRVAAPAAADMQRTLESHRWTLAATTDASGQPIAGLPVAGRAIVFSFADGRLAFEGGCNRSFGGYSIEADGRLKVGRMASTMMACEPAAMKIDATLSDLLAAPVRIELSPGATPLLRLVTPAQATLVFSGQMTPEARYGAPTRVFLEVAAQTVPCTNPLDGKTVCLQAREIRFDAQGLKVGAPGAWQPFHDAIEGYRHQPGVRNVLRLKRFDRGTSAAGAARYLYVLDLVVESEVAKR